MSSLRYLLITPCRDEAAYARRTLESVAKQSIAPALWIIVDDGSTDQTPQILAEYAAKIPFIRVMRLENRGFRKLGGGELDAFRQAYATINPGDYQFVCKLDFDLDLPPKYFQTLMEKMEAEPRLGIASGKPYFIDPLTGLRTSEKCGDENAVGMTKFYRITCFHQIGGLPRHVMWDGIDGHLCRMRGWIAASWDEEPIRFIHLRPMHTSHKNWWSGRAWHGAGQYLMGTAPAYMLASALYRMTRPPIIVGGIAMMWGYLKCALTRRERFGDAEFRRFLRRYQWACLLKGKSKATAELNARQAGAWRPGDIKDPTM